MGDPNQTGTIMSEADLQINQNECLQDYNALVAMTKQFNDLF